MLNRPGRAHPNLSFVVVWPGFLDQAEQLGGICAASRALLEVTCIAARFCCLSRDECWRELRRDGNTEAETGDIIVYDTSHEYEFIYLDSIQQNKTRVDIFVTISIYSRHL